MFGVYPNDPPTSFRRFVGEDLEKLGPARVVYALGYIGAGKGLNVQVFVDDGSIAVYQLPGYLVVEVFALVGDLAVELGYLEPGLLPAALSLLLPGKLPLGLGQLFPSKGRWSLTLTEPIPWRSTRFPPSWSLTPVT